MANKGKSKNSRSAQKDPAPSRVEPPRPKDAEADEAAGTSCPVVGFGASAGGLEAMTDVLHELPDDTGMAIVFIQHLDPKHSSMLSDLLSRATNMPVKQVVNGMKAEPNHVYVIAPNSCIAIRRGTLMMEPRDPTVPHMPVDYFFRSLAEDQGSKAIGIVLSGTASDGTLGLKAIKEAGGISLAQDPESAKYDGMPRSAMVAGCVDAALTTEGIAAELVRLFHHPYINRPRPVEEVPEHERAIEEIMGMLRSAKGVDFSHYKPGTVRRRTLRRMAIHRLESPGKYAKYLKANRDELDLLFNDILIHVTSFFREPSTFTAITTQVLPAILKNRSQDDPVRVWVPGCATGEEAYSVAICILEYMRQTGAELSVQLFGTDLSDVALEQARAGIYPQSIEADVSPERLRRFFVPTNGMYQIARSVRDMCIFARQNVTKDPPFSKLDLITCRNLLIYLGHTLQSKVMRLFHYALKPAGYLVLGASETVGNATELFTPVDRQHKIYSRKATPAIITNDFGGYEEPHVPKTVKHNPQQSSRPDDEKKIDQILLANYTSPAVVVDGELRVLQFRGDTSPYLRNPSGNATLNIMKLARGTLAAEIHKVLSGPIEKTGPTKSKALTFSVDGSNRRVALSILPVEGASDRQFLIVFDDLKEPERPAPKSLPEGKGAGMTERIKELESELSSTKRYLHSVIEEQEAATEELKSAHEEVQSSNEELQSTNEELLTAKEELQSTNEELTTVNDEMQSRNAELQQINNDLTNLLSSVNIPIVMLGNDLRIRRFTPHAEKILNLLPTDVGRPINDFRLKINVPDLVELCQEVIDSLVPREREVHDTESRLYSMWIRPYRTADNRIDGVVLALFDITGRKESGEARYRRLFEAAKDGIVIADAATGEIVDANPFVTRLFGYSRAGLMGVRYWETDLFRNSEIDEQLARDLRERESVQKSLVLLTESGDAVAIDATASLYSEGDRQVIQFHIRDNTARKRMEEQLQQGQDELREAQKIEGVGRLAAGVAHDFNNILTTVLGYSDLLNQRLANDDEGRKLVEQIRAGADRAIAVTRQLLAFGRKQVVAPTIVDVNTVISDLRQIIAVMMTKGVELQVKLQPGLWQVRADRIQLEQVVLNLVLNARDAMRDAGAVTVTTANLEADQKFCQAHPTVPAGSYVAVTVQDRGTGMDEQTQQHMFEPFFTTKPKGSGTGLGLSTVYSIVKQAGGYVSAYTELGKGTSFTIYLPRVAGPPREQRAVSAEQRGTETVLLVEDEHAVRELARQFLEIQGYHVLEAANGGEALRAARRHSGPIQIMVTDVIMPKMSGREVALQLASERPEMKVLYMSGHTDDAVVDHGVLQEGVEFLQKPFSRNELVNRVRKILDGK